MQFVACLISMNEPDLENDLPVNETIAQLVYDELGHQVVKIDDVLHIYKENDLHHTPSYEMLEKRAAAFRSMRGVLQEMGDWNLRK